jgi:hypothetical protein
MGNPVDKQVNKRKTLLLTLLIFICIIGALLIINKIMGADLHRFTRTTITPTYNLKERPKESSGHPYSKAFDRLFERSGNI